MARGHQLGLERAVVKTGDMAKFRTGKGAQFLLGEKASVKTGERVPVRTRGHLYEVVGQRQ